MNSRRCLKIADRIDVLLQSELGRGIDLQRMVAEPLYTRDVLLVCDAHRGHELSDLARQYRAAQAEVLESETVPESSAAPSGWGAVTSGFMSSLFDAFRPSQSASALPPEAVGHASRAERERLARLGGLLPERSRR
jgi:hypothetical protein